LKGKLKMAKSNKKKWMKFRHKVVRNVLFPTLGLYSRLRYNATVERFKEQEDRPYLILLNHQTPFDQFFVGMAFKGPIYYLATEDIFSKGFVSSLIKYLVAPIPIKKQTTDVKAILNCIRVAREGGTIAIAPEGNRTYSGRTEYMSPSIVPLARKLGNPIALYRLEGGYGTHPRWSDVVRRGKMRGYVSRVIYPEEYASMTDDELFAIIEQGLYVDEAVADKKYRHKKRAEYLERAIYVCPFCGLSEFESHDDKLECKKCGRVVKYLETTELVGDGFEHPYRFVADWYDAQKDFINSFDALAHCYEPLYCEEVSVYEVIPCEKKELLSEESRVTLFGDRLILSIGGEDIVCPFEDISSVAVLGRNKLNVYHGDKIYQLKGSKRFNALKYVHIYHRHKNIVKGDANGEFLGL
jgi:1-acyl-sn-glycerol-3-phosphate acyltransferase